MRGRCVSERWESIKGYSGLYEISNLGNIRSPKKISQVGHILKPKKIKFCNKIGYNVVCLRKDNKRKHILVHRLVAIQFIKNTLKKNQINHKDGDKLNNYIDNLEWVDCKGNINHCWKTGLHRRHNGENNPATRLKNKDIKSIRKASTLSQKELAVKYNISPSAINKIIKRETWKHI